MLKPYLYGGLALLIVGLFCFLGYQTSRIESLQSQLTEANGTVEDLRRSNNELIASSARKVGAAAAYSAMTTHVENLTKANIGIIKGYRARETENEKCLDMRPPTNLVERLREAGSVSGQDSIRKAQ